VRLVLQRGYDVTRDAARIEIRNNLEPPPPDHPRRSAASFSIAFTRPALFITNSGRYPDSGCSYLFLYWICYIAATSQRRAPSKTSLHRGGAVPEQICEWFISLTFRGNMHDENTEVALTTLH